jgi:hypothetical protein
MAPNPTNPIVLSAGALVAAPVVVHAAPRKLVGPSDKQEYYRIA